MAELTYEPQPHPYLHEPRIFVSGLPLWITDVHLANALQFCAPFRPNIIRDQTQPLAAGTIEFRFLEKAEKALATLHDRSIPEVTPSVTLNLSPFPYTNPPTPLPPPAALPRLVKHLPPGYTDSMLYDIFRPYGALANVRTGVTGPDSALIEYWREEDARVASETLHCADIGGANIAIQLYQPRRAPGPQAPELHASAPSFMPTGGGFSYPNAQYSPSPPRGSPFSRGQLPFVHGPGQQVQPAPPGTSHSGLIDPCNLFCKNLDPEIDSNGLFSHFRRFGQIVSARVMRNETGESRGFGFVSFQQPEQANAALAAMNGAMLGTKAIVVRLHEPKQFRQEKLAARFQGNGHPRSASGATSPTLSVDGDSSFGGGNWNSPRHVSSPLASPHSGNGNFQERHIRRASGSYYTAALNGTLSVPLDYDGLASLSPVMRREILTGELSKRVRALDAGVSDIDTIVEDLINLALSDVVQGLADNTRLAEQIASVQQQRQQQQQQAESQVAPAAETEGASGTVTAPEHPSTPVSLGPSLATPPRTASPAGSIAPQGTERERMAAAITKIAPGQSDALTDLLMSLPKKERAQCLFNPERLRVKVGEAQAILEADDEDEEGPSSATTSAPTPATPVSKPAPAPATPELSRAPSAAPSPMPATPSAPTTAATEAPVTEGAAHTLVSLARLPAAEIVRLASAGTVTGVPLPKADPAVIAQTDKFIDDMRDKPVQSQKQALGDKLFRVVKAFGIKGAPKLTIKLLDSEDLRALAHLMNSYPSVLKEKALLVQAETK